MYVITWNMQRDRAPAVVFRELRELLAGWKPKVVELSEAGGYADLLENIHPGHYQRVQFFTSPGMRESAFLVRNDVELDRAAWAARMTWRGWERQTGIGGITAPKWAPTIVANGVRFVGVHLPPSVRWWRGVPVGPPLRVAAYRSYARNLVALVDKSAPTRPVVPLGDWNATPGATGRYSPRWIARNAGAVIEAPSRPTTGHRPDGPVDYAMARNCRIENVRVLVDFDHGADHDPVGFQVHPLNG